MHFIHVLYNVRVTAFQYYKVCRIYYKVWQVKQSVISIPFLKRRFKGLLNGSNYF